MFRECWFARDHRFDRARDEILARIQDRPVNR